MIGSNPFSLELRSGYCFCCCLDVLNKLRPVIICREFHQVSPGLPDDGLVSVSINTHHSVTNMFNDTLGQLSFADKGISTGRESSLLAGAHMADEDNDQS